MCWIFSHIFDILYRNILCVRFGLCLPKAISRIFGLSETVREPASLGSLETGFARLPDSGRSLRGLQKLRREAAKDARRRRACFRLRRKPFATRARILHKLPSRGKHAHSACLPITAPGGTTGASGRLPPPPQTVKSPLSLQHSIQLRVPINKNLFVNRRLPNFKPNFIDNRRVQC